jgi:hypothetical protein
VGEKEKPEEWKKKGGTGEARAAAPVPSPWQPAGVRRIPQAPCLSRCSGRKKKGEAGGEEEKEEREPHRCFADRCS